MPLPEPLPLPSLIAGAVLLGLFELASELEKRDCRARSISRVRDCDNSNYMLNDGQPDWRTAYDIVYGGLLKAKLIAENDS